MTQPPPDQPPSPPPQKKAHPKHTMSELETLIRARYPLLYIVSWEEQRVTAEVTRIATKLGKGVFEWSVNTGLVASGTSLQAKKNRDTATQDPLVAMDKAVEHVDPALYVFKDFHPFLKGQNMSVIRKMREVAFSLKSTFKTIILVSPMIEMPHELEKDLTLIDFDLPKQQHFKALLERILEEVKDNPKLSIKITPALKEQIVHALLGLTLNEAENVLARALVQDRGLSEQSLEVINHEKKQIIRKNGLLEYYDAKESMDSVGGLDQLKDWLLKRKIVFTNQARDFGLPAPRGILLLGVQGCGKSLMAKTISTLWKLPMLRFDVGRVFGSLVGSSEQNMRMAIQIAESVSPIIFWIDEIDKAFRGSRGSSTDSGTSSRVFSTFLTWMSEKKHPVFVVATANDVTSLPPELLRKGRFDEIFFVDLPSQQEREAIFRIHLTRRKLNPQNFDLSQLSSEASGFSGAEIEEAIVSSMFDAFYEKQPLSTERLLASIGQTVPLSKIMSEDVETLRQWASNRARSATSKADNGAGGMRQLEI